MSLESIFQAVISYDEALSALIRSASSSRALDFLMPWVSDKRAWILPVCALLAYSWRSDRKKAIRLITFSLVVVIAADLSATALKGVTLRPRPIQLVEELHLIKERPAGSSFPSNHATNSFALCTLLAIHHPQMRALFFSVAVLVSYSKVYLGDHYVGDVVAGALLGSAWALLFVRAARRLTRRGQPPQPSGRL